MDSGPNRLIPVRSGSFGSNWSVTIRFDKFGSKSGYFDRSRSKFQKRFVTMGQFPNQIESQSTKTNRQMIVKITKFLFEVPFSLSDSWFLLLSQFIEKKFTNWRSSKKAKIFIFDLEHFQKFWSFSILAFQKIRPLTIFSAFLINQCEKSFDSSDVLYFNDQNVFISNEF